MTNGIIFTYFLEIDFKKKKKLREPGQTGKPLIH